ncbi:MAG: 2-dehydropantoate 2-reductase [Kiritimatiellae bacterium]|nr:2-dehydropantoate 2-reductase [Kiritimatiellia bacterium]
MQSSIVNRQSSIVVVGPGAMGCLFAGLLAEAGHEVWVLDRDAERAARLGSRGLELEGVGGRRTVRVRATADPGALPSPGVLFLFVKSYDTARATESVRGLAGAGPTFVSLQNGMGNAKQMARFVASSQIVAGITGHGATALGEGRVRHAGAGRTLVGAIEPAGAARAGRVAALLSAAGVATEVVRDLRGALWSKLVVNAAINPVTAVAGVPNGALLEDPALRQQMHAAAAEAAGVARALGIRLLYDDEREEADAVCRRTAGNLSSMLQDVRRGTRTEIEAITGAIVREAEAAGVDVPTNRMLLERVRRMGGVAR